MWLKDKEGNIFKAEDIQPDCTIATQEEVNLYNLQEVKGIKKKELQDYYDSESCWMFTLQSTSKKASRTKDADWFKINMPPCYDKTIMLFSDKGDIITYDLSRTVGELVVYTITAIRSFEITNKKVLCEKTIESCKTEAEVQAIDIKTSLEVDRIITLETLK